MRWVWRRRWLFSPDRTPLEIGGRERDEALTVAVRSVSPDYFDLFGIPILRGRRFTSGDREGAPRVAIVNERAAQLFWPDGEVAGRRVRCGGADWIAVAGVAANVHSVGLARPPAPEIYLPFAQHPTDRVSLALRVEGDPMASLPLLAGIVNAVEPQASVTYANSMSALLDEQLALVRALSAFGAIFASIALLLAGTGLYGAISCLYARRTKEIGIRMALGASPGEVVRLVAASSAKLACLGCVAGVIVGSALGRLFQAAVFGVAGVDGAVLAAAVAIIAVVVFGATCVPAARAAGIEPASAIRCE